MATDAIGRRASQRDRERFPDVWAEINEDPARWLDREPLGKTADARIDGIDFLDVVDYWVRGETELDRGPLREVIAKLNQRKAWLQEHGERSDRAGRVVA
jgi:hypothetical protein